MHEMLSTSLIIDKKTCKRGVRVTALLFLPYFLLNLSILLPSTAEDTIIHGDQHFYCPSIFVRNLCALSHGHLLEADRYWSFPRFLCRNRSPTERGPEQPASHVHSKGAQSTSRLGWALCARNGFACGVYVACDWNWDWNIYSRTGRSTKGGCRGWW